MMMVTIMIMIAIVIIITRPIRNPFSQNDGLIIISFSERFAGDGKEKDFEFYSFLPFSFMQKKKP